MNNLDDVSPTGNNAQRERRTGHEPKATPATGANANNGGAVDAITALVRALRVQVPIPRFRGTKGENPQSFKKTALDYMTRAGYQPEEFVLTFQQCLEGKARDWYDRLPADKLTDWDKLMDEFCKKYCIYGDSPDEWYRRWTSLTFDPSSDMDIDDYITEVQMLSERLHLDETVVRSQIMKVFPTHRVHLSREPSLEACFGLLRIIYPLHRDKSSYSPGNNPFSVHTPRKESDLTPSSDKRVHFDQAFVMNDTMERLTDSMDRLMMVSDKVTNAKRTPTKPYKPYLTRGRGHNRPDTPRPPFRTNFRDRYRPRSNFRSRFRSQSPFRPRFNNSKPRYPFRRRFDKSPVNRRPRIASRSVSRDRDRCYNCQEFGHMAKDCKHRKTSANQAHFVYNPMPNEMDSSSPQQESSQNYVVRPRTPTYLDHVEIGDNPSMMDGFSLNQ